MGFFRLIFFIFILFFPFFVLAEEKTRDIPIEVSLKILGQQRFADLAEYIGVIYQYLVGIAGIFAAVMIMYAGIKWIFAAGDSSKISSAKETIVHAVMGLALALGSYLILRTINPSLVRFSVPDIKSVQQQFLAAGACPNTGEFEGRFQCGKQYALQDKGITGRCLGAHCDRGPGGAALGCWGNGELYQCLDAAVCPTNCDDLNNLPAVQGKPDQLVAYCASDICRSKIPGGCRVGFRGNDSSRPVCLPRLAAGQWTCESNEDCAFGLRCNFAELPNSCRPAGGLEAGLACDNDQDCQSGICNEGFVIDQCAPKGGSLVGEACDFDDDCGSKAGSERVCNEAFFIDACAKLRSLTSGERCDRDALCASGVCEGEEEATLGEDRSGNCK
ncbi:hypothetical protein HY628_02660 [Candidatus Uhrbacteria bacterium]|nr:hypothetical protein [Candidatus Uhrbacteria bacterium]